MQVVANTHYGTTVTAILYSKFSQRALPGATHEDMSELHDRQNAVHQDHLNGLHQQFMSAGTRGERKAIKKQINFHAGQAAKHQKMAKFFENTNPNKASIPRPAKPAAPSVAPSAAPAAAKPAAQPRGDFENLPKFTPRAAPVRPRANEPEHDDEDEEHEDHVTHPNQGTTNLGHEEGAAPKPKRPMPTVNPVRPEAAKAAEPKPSAPSAPPKAATPSEPEATAPKPRSPMPTVTPVHPSQAKAPSITHHAARLWHSLAPKVKSWFAAKRPNSPISKAHNTGNPRLPMSPKDTSDMHKEQSDYHVRQANLANKAAQIAPTPEAKEKAEKVADTHVQQASNHSTLAKKAAAAPPVKNPVKLPSRPLPKGVVRKTPEEVAKGKDMSRKAPAKAPAKPVTPSRPLPKGVVRKTEEELAPKKASSKAPASKPAAKAPAKKATAKPPTTVRPASKPAAKAPAKKAPAKAPAKKPSSKVKPINPARL